MTNNFADFSFIYGRALSDTNVYIFENSKKDVLTISEKIGKFQKGSKSQYLLFSYIIGGEEVKEYIDRDSQDYRDMLNIRPIVDNLAGQMVQCKNCGHILDKSKIRSSNNDKCIYCDIYYCKKCRKAHPIIELDEDRLCERCRNGKEEHT